MTTAIPDAGLKCNSVYGSITSLYTVPAELSLCVTLQITAEQYAAMTVSINILGSVNGTSWFNLIRRAYTGNDRLQWEYKNSNVMTSSIAAPYYASYTPTITDGKPHKLVCCVSAAEKKIKAFLDGVLIGTADLSATPPAEFTATNCFRLGTLYPNYNLQGGGVISNIKYFNFDISADGAAYTLDDYQNDKDVPDELSSAYIVSPDKEYPIVNTTTNTNPSTWMLGDPVNRPSISYTDSKQLQVTLGAGSIYTPVIKMILPKPLKANEPITFNFMGDGTQTGSSTVDVGLFMGIGHGAGYVSDAVQTTESSLSGSGKLICNGTYTLTSSQPADYIILRLRNGAEIPAIAGAVYTFPKFSVSVAGKVLELQNKISGTTWQDESGNGYDMALQGDFEIVDI